jgi:H+/Cl- antiporter ClcA
VVLAVLLPLAALLGVLAVRRGTAPRKPWSYVALLSFLLFAASFTAVRTGEQGEDKVENVVSEDAIHDHEEQGERLQVMAGISFLVFLTGFSGGSVGRIARPAALAASLAMAYQAYLTGGSGGELVYRHGAASAYVDGTATAGRTHSERERERDD